MDKVTFIKQLEDKTRPADLDRQAYESLSNDEFAEHHEYLPKISIHEHQWSATEFLEVVNHLKNDFTREYCEHAIAVKAYLQKRAEDGLQEDFRVVSQTEQVSSNKTAADQSADDRQTQAESNLDQSLTEEQAREYVQMNLDEATIKKALEGYQPSERLAGFLEQGDWSKVRIDLTAQLNNRRQLTVEDVIKSMYYVQSYYPQVFEEYEVSAFAEEVNKSESAWNIDYFNAQQGYLSQNFSLERFFHLINVRETLAKKGDKNFAQLEPTKKPAEKAQHVQSAQTSQPERSQTDRQQSQQNTKPSQGSARPTAGEQSSSQDQSKSFVKKALIVGGAVLVAIGLLMLAIK